MKTYKVEVPVQVLVSVEVTARNEREAFELSEELDFQLVETVRGLEPTDKGLTCVALEPDYDKLEIEEIF